MRRILIVIAGLIAINLSACVRYADPAVVIPTGSKAVIGSIKVEANDTFNTGQPASFFLRIAPISLVSDEKGKIQYKQEARAASYTLKSAWKDATLPSEVPFFIPLRPGMYMLTEAKFDYVGSFYEMPLNNGLPFIVSAKTDATYMGRMVVVLNRNNLTSTMRTETDPKVKELYLAKNPNHTIRDLVIQLE